ncbi:hypothetical protein [Epilithonimonas vandammei]|uniref:Uncharacterized protein n=1 Tax=Epilithonimonas vandammei TaxID=2487072 RepID=A0A3G8Y1R5_9FLAO|nr:hypothetical protein [Epilithonimonas vandammei]AZI39315.1 hypothetical protein EIB74_04770 [Epilithonimonas vandammei]
MKKLFPFLLLFITSFILFNCKEDDEVQVQVDYPAVYDLRNVNFSYNATDGWSYGQSFKKPLLDQDYVVIFRQTGTSGNAPVWQQIPRTLYLDQGELDYDFDFSKNDFMIYAGGTYDLSTTPQYLNNQTFRVVLVPAVYGKNATLEDLKKLSYEEIIAKYNIDESKIGTL